MGRKFNLLFLTGLPLVFLIFWAPALVQPAGHQLSGPTKPGHLTAYHGQGAGHTAYAIHPGQGQSPYSSDKQVIARGKALFQKDCAGCHTFGQRKIGPDLTGITALASATWITRIIRNAPQVINRGDARARRLMTEYKQYMPPFPDLSDADIRALVAYIHTQRNQSDMVTAAAPGEPLVDPIPAAIAKAGLKVSLKMIVKAPSTSTTQPFTRINKMRVVSMGTTSRHFVQEQRGVIYEMVNSTLRVFIDISKLYPNFIRDPGLGTGSGGLAFDPDFKNNGLFYTAHSEKATAGTADFAYDSNLPVAMQWVLVQWDMTNPAATAFSGTSREIMRINVLTQIHGIQELNFNPLAQPGSPDHGLLYLAVGDGGAGEQKASQLCNSNKTIWGSVLRIDPAGRNSTNGKYGIPAINPYAQDSDPTTLGEIYARGFRNPNRFTWAPDGKMLIADIGLKNIEELNIGQAGADYGWPAREGTFLVDYQGDMTKVYPLPPNDAAFGYTYPVAQYDHGSGKAFSGGLLYTGTEAPLLQGKYIFGDIVNGRVFCVTYNELIPGQQAIIKELDLQIDGKLNTFLKTTNYKKADLRFGLGPGQKFYMFTKTDGRIYQVTGASPQ